MYRHWPTDLAGLLRPTRRRLFLATAARGTLAAWFARATAVATASAIAPPSAVPPPATLIDFIDFLIPKDDLTPAASALGVPQQIWSEAVADKAYHRLVEFACNWLDSAAPDGFAALTGDAKAKLAQWMCEAPWESPQRRFFDVVRDRSMMYYYSQPPSWRGLPVERPPQPVGYKLD